MVSNTNKSRLSFNNYNFSIGLNDTSVIPLNTWTHITLTYGSKMYNIYFNGNFDGSGNTTEKLNNITRMYNYIGKSFFL